MKCHELFDTSKIVSEATEKYNDLFSLLANPNGFFRPGLKYPDLIALDDSFEAEQGEILAVVNRNASRMLMDFNDRFAGTSSAPRRNYFADGGIVARTNASSTMKIDYDLLASKIGANVGNAVANLPSPIVAVTDINDGQNSYAQVVNGADVV